MGNIDDLAMYSLKRGFSPLGFLNSLIADGSIKLSLGIVSVDIKNKDLQRVNDIIHALDDRRAFYNAFQDEMPEHVVTSVREAKKDIYDTSKGLWSNLWAKEIVQRILHDLGDFLTKVEKHPLPKVSDEACFEEFLRHLLELRLRLWTYAAHFVVVFGDIVRAYHMPKEILEKVTLAYLDSKRK